MIKIKDFIEQGFQISWTLLHMGFSGGDKIKKQLTGQDIINYAITKIEEGDESVEVVLLAGSHNVNTEEINDLLIRLSKNEKVDYNIEYRKWRVIYLLKHLPNIHDDYIQGIIKIGDIWAALDFPDDSPRVFQGLNNSITPIEYYTQENYIRLLENNRAWLNKEIAELKGK